MVGQLKNCPTIWYKALKIGYIKRVKQIKPNNHSMNFKAFTVSALALTVFAPASAQAMSLAEAKVEICEAAREYKRWGTYKQSTQEIYSYSSFLASENGFGTPGRRALQEKGMSCLMGF